MASCPSSARRDLRAREQTIGDASCVCRSPSPQIDVGQERACRRIAVDLVKGPSVCFRVETVCAEALKEALGWQVNWSRCGHMDRLHYGHPRHGIDHTIGWNSGNPYPCAARDVIASPEGLRCPEVEPVASNGCGLLLLRTAFAITTKEWQRDHEGPVCDVKARGRFGLEPTMSIVATQVCVSYCLTVSSRSCSAHAAAPRSFGRRCVVLSACRASGLHVRAGRGGKGPRRDWRFKLRREKR